MSEFFELIGIFNRSICERNQVHIPKEIMEECGLRKGMLIYVAIRSEKAVVFTKRICQRNQIYIPKEIMDECGLQQGMSIVVSVQPVIQNQTQDQPQEITQIIN